MNGNGTPRRVALVDMGRLEDELQTVRGVLAYVRHAPHWRFVEDGDQPTLPFDRVDLTSIDGLIVSVFDDPTAEAIRRAGLPAVNTSNLVHDIDLPRVANDDLATGRLAAEHLLPRGFGSFGFVAREGAWFSERRHRAFSEFVAESTGQACHVVTPRHPLDDGGRSMLREWVASVPKPIAVMACTDHLGRHVVDAASDLGFRVPEDVAVIGVDRNDWVSALATTPLSSVEPDWHQIGYQAAKTLDGLMSGEAPPPPRFVEPVGVVTRRSTDIHLAQDPLVVEALRYIRDHVGEGIGVEHVLEALRVSRRTLENRMKRVIGQTPKVAIARAQVDQARRMLLETDAMLRDIARACGFRRQERFSLVFKKYTGMTPGRYRKVGGVKLTQQRLAK